MNDRLPTRRTRMPRLCGAALLLIGAPAILAATGEPDTIQLAGVIRDFKASDQTLKPDAAHDLHVSGLLQGVLDENLNPVYSGEGSIVESEARDAAGNPISPQLAKPGEELDDFDIVGGHLIPNQDFTARITLLGAAIENGSYHIPVTTRFRVGDQTFEPFGSYDSPVYGNVNDNQSATGNRNVIESRVFDLPGIYSAETAITVDGTSWTLGYGSASQDSSWDRQMTESSYDNSIQVSVLRDGDPVPNISGAYDQASVGEYVSDYVDSDTQTMTLDANQAIWLFELGLDASHPSADFQDLVVLVSLATGTDVFDEPTTDCAAPVNDTEAQLGEPSTAGIDSPETVQNWFTTNPTVNISQTEMLTLERASDGMYVFDSPDFTPIDEAMFGKENKDHNRSFTYEIHAEFEYQQCSGQVFEYSGTGDVWVYINGVLAMDLGGSANGAQRIDLDRLDLADGESCRLSFFYVNRRGNASPFQIRTNLGLRNSMVQLPPSVVLRD